MPARKKINEYQKVFVRGIASGIGWAFGATIVFALLVTVLSGMFSFLRRVPIIGEWFRPVAEVVDRTDNPKKRVFENNKPTIIVDGFGVDRDGD